MLHSPPFIDDDWDRGDGLTTTDHSRLLQAPIRRVTLSVLSERSAPIGLDELTTAVSERAAETDSTLVESDHDVLITLHHVHLPLMAQLGLLEYEPSANRITSLHL